MSAVCLYKQEADALPPNVCDENAGRAPEDWLFGDKGARS